MRGCVQPIAAGIGENCGIEEWTIELFSEEVVRGGPAFAVSLVLATVEPALRRHADLGAWQIISPADVVGAIAAAPPLPPLTAAAVARQCMLAQSARPCNVRSVYCTGACHRIRSERQLHNGVCCMPRMWGLHHACVRYVHGHSPPRPHLLAGALVHLATGGHTGRL